MPNAPSNARSTAILLSGGLDSAILLAELLGDNRRMQPIYIRSGLCWEPAELHYVRRFLRALAGPRLDPLRILDLPVGDLYGDHWSVTGRGVPDAASEDAAVYLPGRNLLLVIKAALWCQMQNIGELALGVLGSNPFGDARPEFFVHCEAAIQSATGSRTRLLRPFASRTKREVMLLGRGLPLELTFSCIAPVSRLHCGRCNKCAERQHAFADAGIADPTPYASPCEVR